jgi:hypothetical protein
MSAAAEHKMYAENIAKAESGEYPRGVARVRQEVEVQWQWLGVERGHHFIPFNR